MDSYLEHCRKVLSDTLVTSTYEDLDNHINAVRDVLMIDRKVLGRTKEKPASAFIRLALEERMNIKPQHDSLRGRILKKGLQHPNVIERDQDTSPLSKFEKEYFTSLLNRIYGACVTQQPYLPAYEDLKNFVIDVFKRPVLSNIHVGTIISFLSNHCRSLFTMAKLDPNTSRKVIKQVAPERASRRGRGSPIDKQLLADFVQEHYGLSPAGI